MIWYWLLYNLANIIIACINNETRIRRNSVHNYKQIEHGWYFAGYIALCAIMLQFNWQIAVSVLLLHGCAFPVSYNLWAGLPPFWLSKTSKAIYDRTLYKFFDDSFLAVALSFIASVVFLVWAVMDASLHTLPHSLK